MSHGTNVTVLPPAYTCVTVSSLLKLTLLPAFATAALPGASFMSFLAAKAAGTAASINVAISAKTHRITQLLGTVARFSRHHHDERDCLLRCLQCPKIERRILQPARHKSRPIRQVRR